MEALIDVALDYAARGWPVLPLHSWTGEACTCGRSDCSSPAKHPRTQNGLKNASTDEAQIRAWWKKWPDANIGLRTGDAFDVLDVDGDEGWSSLLPYFDKHGDFPAGPVVVTGGGGWHYFFLPTGENNKAGFLPKVDWRGQQGYVVAAESLHSSGAHYGWGEALGPDLAFPAAPKWLVDLIAPPKRERPMSDAPRSLNAGGASEYGRRALEAELEELGRAAVGTRNHSLNVAAFNLFQLVAGGELEEHATWSGLMETALSIGLGESEARGTINSGRKGGFAHPRSAPELRVIGANALKAQIEEEPPPPPLPNGEEHEAGAEPAPPDGMVRLNLRWVTDAFEHPPAPRHPVIRGLFNEGDLTVIGAPRAIGKSMLAMNMATLLGRGAGLLGGALQIAQRQRVLYCQGELNEHESYLRWFRMAGSEGPPPGVAETFDQWRIRVVRRRQMTSGRDQSQGWSESDEFIDGVVDPRLEQTIATEGIQTVIIDPWAVYFGGMENSNDEVEVALSKLRELTLRYGVSFVLFHHIGKSRDAAEPEDLWRGASRLADWASNRVTIMPHYSEREAQEMQMSRQDARRFVDVFLLRRGEPTPDFSMVIDHKTGWWCHWNAPGRPVKTTHTSADVAAKCAEDGGWSSIGKAAASLEVSRPKATELVDRAVAEGVLEEVLGERNARAFIPTEGMR